MYAVVVNFDGEIERKSVHTIAKKYPDDLLPSYLKNNSKYPYYVGQRMFSDSSSCTRTDIEDPRFKQQLTVKKYSCFFLKKKVGVYDKLRSVAALLLLQQNY